ncbi:hypothetical protein AB0M43_35330 [Longispora sp. NPDC051575]|uniref:hypothetical protein n=1 Tax=Longispora sp. NPDC051575 TaxID=3154943 RepID=UPI00341A8BC6
MPFDPDTFVAWMAERKEGGMPDLRRKLTWLADGDDTGVRTWVTDAVGMGKVDVDWNRNRWLAGPLLVTRLPGSGGVGLLAGAITPAIRQAASDLAADIVEHRHEELGRILAPPTTVWLQYDDSDHLRLIADTIGASFEPCAAERMTRKLEPISWGDTAAAPPSRHNAGLRAFQMRQGQFEDCAWSPELQDGLYEIMMFGSQRQYLFRRNGDWYRTTRSVGIHLQLPQEGYPLRWRAHNGGGDRYVAQLMVDAPMSLPPAQHRTAVFCTGLPARRSSVTGTWMYDGIPRNTAETIAWTLRRRLEIES